MHSCYCCYSSFRFLAKSKIDNLLEEKHTQIQAICINLNCNYSKFRKTKYSSAVGVIIVWQTVWNSIRICSKVDFSTDICDLPMDFIILLEVDLTGFDVFVCVHSMLHTLSLSLSLHSHSL